MRIAVVGGGIAGLAAAWFLREHDVTVLEGSPRIGGKLRTIALEGLPVDVGAEALLARRPEAVELARAVGLGDAVRSPGTTSAGLWLSGGVAPIPAGTVQGVPADLEPLAASGVLSEAELARAARDLELPGDPVVEDVAIGAYARKRLGDAVVDRLIEPLLGGVYAGSSDGLSLQATASGLAGSLRTDPSLIRAARAAKAAAAATTAAGASGADYGRDGASTGRPASVFAGLDGGLGSLPAAVAEAAEASGVTVRTNAMVRELARTPTGWRLTIGPTRAPEAYDVDAVLLACPARPASRLLRDVAPFAAAELAGIEYASTAIIAYAFATNPRSPLQGSGFLVPPTEGRLIKAATYSSVKWPWLGERSGGRLTVVRCSVGRYREEADLQRTDEELAAAALVDLRTAAGPALDGLAPIDTAVQRWGGGLPQYAPGHAGRVARIRSALAASPGLAVAGAAYDGLGVPACVATAEAAAHDLLHDVRMRV